MNFAYTYLTLFLNEKPLLFKTISLYSKYTLTSLFFISFSVCSFLLFVNPINLNPLWIDKIPDLKRMQILHILSGFVFFLLAFFAYSILPTRSILSMLFVYINLFFLYWSRFRLFNLPIRA